MNSKKDWKGMFMTDYNLDEGAVLSEVKRYALYQGKERGQLFIDVYRTIAGPEKEKYLAMPNLIFAVTKREFITAGETEDEALRKCLDLVKGVPPEDIH